MSTGGGTPAGPLPAQVPEEPGGRGWHKAGRVVVVGGGIVGTMHALFALDRGLTVLHLEASPEPRGASVRNFGLVWVSGRAGGAELALALRARELWSQLSLRAPGTGFRPAGSLTVATDDAELALMEEALRRPDAASRQWQLLDGNEARRVNPELRAGLAGALWCRADAIVEPRLAVHAIRRYLCAQPGYTWASGRAVLDLGPYKVRDDLGTWHVADRVFVCTGAGTSTLSARHVGAPRARPVRLQMLETATYTGELPTSVADGDSMRYYPAFDLPGRAGLAPQDGTAARAGAQLLMVQRAGGGLTIGDTHDYDEPFPFDLEEGVYAHLLAKAAGLLSRPLPGVRRRWAGVYTEVPKEAQADGGLYWREELVAGVEVVSGLGGRGMTCAPAVAEESLDAMGAART
jgi:FAD dependent oxidoreductase TIGR03364